MFLTQRSTNEVIAVENDDAFAAGKLVGKKEGILVGISSGAAIWAALELAKRPEKCGERRSWHFFRIQETDTSPHRYLQTSTLKNCIMDEEKTAGSCEKARDPAVFCVAMHL